MNDDLLKQDILTKIRQIAAANGGRVPGREKFLSETGIKPHEWRGRIWRNWSDAIAEAGFEPNERQAAFNDDELLAVVCSIAKDLKRFPSTSDIDFDTRRHPNSPSAKTILARWKMPELAVALASYADAQGDVEVAEYARLYSPPRLHRLTNASDDATKAIGYVYMQRHAQDYKIGFTTSLNKRGRQIQIELPQEIELVHAILTDDPPGVEAYWHRRFADKRTRGEWFRLTKGDVAAFKRWSKIW